MAKNPATLTLSPTKVDTFYGCKRLFLYKYLAPPFSPPENKYFLIGNLAHWVLENLYKQHMVSPITDWNKVMGELFKKGVVKYSAFEKIKQGLITKDDLYSIKDMMTRYLKYLKSLDKLPDIHTVEKLAKIDVGGVVVWLKSDRVDDLGDNTFKVVDYKSGKPASLRDELASVQIPSYGIWIRQQYNKSAKIVGEYVYLKHVGAKHGFHAHDITDEMMDKATKKYQFVDKQLKKGCKFIQNFKYKYCFHCDFRKHCVEDDSDDV